MLTRVMLDVCFFFFNDTATTEIYTLSLHDALPILRGAARRDAQVRRGARARDRPGRGARDGDLRPLHGRRDGPRGRGDGDRKSTRLNSSHANISYAVFCLKKKKNTKSKTMIDRKVS